METYFNNPVFLVFAFLTVTGVVSTIAMYWHKSRRDELEAALKQEMIQRGMSADEIVKVLKGSKYKEPKEAKSKDSSCCG